MTCYEVGKLGILCQSVSMDGIQRIVTWGEIPQKKL